SWSCSPHHRSKKCIALFPDRRPHNGDRKIASRREVSPLQKATICSTRHGSHCGSPVHRCCTADAWCCPRDRASCAHTPAPRSPPPPAPHQRPSTTSNRGGSPPG